jgi:NAD(P)H dehydrogenase (quinone)
MGSKPRVLVMGATGQVGSAVASLLSRNKALETVAAARNVSKVQTVGVSLVCLDLDKPDTFAPALAGVDRIFMATGYTVDMLRQSKDLVNTAKKAAFSRSFTWVPAETMIRALLTTVGISLLSVTSSGPA